MAKAKWPEVVGEDEKYIIAPVTCYVVEYQVVMGFKRLKTPEARNCLFYIYTIRRSGVFNVSLLPYNYRPSQ